MKHLFLLMTVIIGSSVVPVRAQQIPETPPTQWSVSIRFYGTTDMPGRDSRQILVHTNGTTPASIQARLPAFNDKGNITSASSEHQEKLTREESAAIYSAARTVILSHRIGDEPVQKIKDGDSVEVTIASFDRKISAVLDHSSAVNSKEFEAMIKVFHSNLPKDLLPRIK